MKEEDIDFMDMYVLAHEFHYTPDQIKKMDMVDKADLISFWQGTQETHRKQHDKGSKGKNRSKKFDEDQIIQDLVDQKERNDRQKNGP